MIAKDIQLRVLQWLSNQERSASSQTMAFWLAFVIRQDGVPHPRDPSDFSSCLDLFVAVPDLRAYLHRMAKLSPSWKGIVGDWESIESMFLHETGARSAGTPKTYALIKDAQL